MPRANDCPGGREGAGPLPSNRKRLRAVLRALRKRRDERDALAGIAREEAENIVRLRAALDEHDRARPIDRHRRKLAAWQARRVDLEQDIAYAVQRAALAERRTEEHDVGTSATGLSWMLRELLRQRRRMRRAARVVQLRLPFVPE